LGHVTQATAQLVDIYDPYAGGDPGHAHIGGLPCLYQIWSI